MGCYTNTQYYIAIQISNSLDILHYYWMLTDVFMRYIGSKRCLIKHIDALINKKVTTQTNANNLVLLDLFSGTTVVAQQLKAKYEVITNDIMYFSYVIARGQVSLNTIPDFRKLEQMLGTEVLIYLNSLGGVDNAGFIATNYSLFGSDRMYFTEDNAFKIDHIRATIEGWRAKYLNDDAYYYLLACLIEAVPFVSNTSGIYGAYLKTWDNRAFLNLTLKHPIIYDNGLDNKAFNLDANQLVKTDDARADICYIDPPYNSRQYTSNYHLLDTIAYGDNPSIKGVTGMRFYRPEEKSLYCSKPNVLAQFDKLIRDVQAEHLLISYSSDGIMSDTDMLTVLNKYCEPNSVELNKIAYRKYKSKLVNADDALNEFLFYARKPEWHNQTNTGGKVVSIPSSKIKRSDVMLASPLNYIGGKFKLLPQLTPYFPDDINELVDVFSGGLNVGLNVDCQRLIANDLNHFVIELLEVLGTTNIDNLLTDIQRYITNYGLSKTNRDGFLKLRADYNNNPNPVALYALICHSFNYQFRFNSDLEYNNPFGKDRSFFSPSLRRKLILFNQRLSQTNVSFYSLPFQELITHVDVSDKALFYCDPPYLLSTGSYNDGNRGFKDWNESQESALHDALDGLHADGKRFMLSNVTEHKGYRNERLIDWAENYDLINLDFNYDNASYNSKKNNGDFTQEVLIKNF